jgi:hypothetical protein
MNRSLQQASLIVVILGGDPVTMVGPRMVNPPQTVAELFGPSVTHWSLSHPCGTRSLCGILRGVSSVLRMEVSRCTSNLPSFSYINN